ncbi:unnamed protein product [Mytilus coruscus]|uniref:Uncharacterized protein n=1 Tax=Mytilus coruscus TaxID=42192 RepID=A0A6J8E5E1_MYTCO|nr:unnamed protein product [Mytilus coruscus]
MMSRDFIILLSLYFQIGSTSTSDITAPVNYQGYCAFECVRQNRVYENVVDHRERETVTSFDPTVLVTTNNGAVSQNSLCFIRSGPFTLVRRDIPDNDTHSEYQCSKKSNCDDSGDVLIFYQSPWNVGCNLPLVCPETMVGQRHCGCDELSIYDDGFCCDKEGSPPSYSYEDNKSGSYMRTKSYKKQKSKTYSYPKSYKKQKYKYYSKPKSYKKQKSKAYFYPKSYKKQKSKAYFYPKSYKKQWWNKAQSKPKSHKKQKSKAYSKPKSYNKQWWDKAHSKPKSHKKQKTNANSKPKSYKKQWLNKAHSNPKSHEKQWWDKAYLSQCLTKQWWKNKSTL